MTTKTNERLIQILRAARKYRTYVRAMAHRSASTCPIHVVAGSFAPRPAGTSFFYTTPGGRPVYHPNAYRKAFGKPVYNASTYRIEVGAEWLAQRNIPAWSMAPVDTAEELIRVGAFGDVGQSAVGLGTTPELALATLPVVGGWVPLAAQPRGAQ